MSLVSTINQAVLSSGFASTSSLSSAAAQEAILKTAFTPDTSELGFSVDTTSNSLTSIINESIQSDQGVNLLDSLQQVGTYSATSALLESAYGQPAAIDKLI